MAEPKSRSLTRVWIYLVLRPFLGALDSAHRCPSCYSGLRMPLVGLDTIDAKSNCTDNCVNRPIDALQNPVHSDPNLLLVVKTWDNLPRPLQDGIVALVKAVRQSLQFAPPVPSPTLSERGSQAGAHGCRQPG